ncbi:pentapeptide repeat-containing protein [Chryseobacterium sp. NRRL B-14798]|uniref:pentapeptide repeat-containing protein n=1 Tax=Chryseobacterium sp. NRRL B-14798 TaxID=3162880 RepID=UPI003D1AF889
MTTSEREKIEDQIIDSDLSKNDNYHNKYFIRIGSKNRNFIEVNFSHTYFENCYFRNVTFNSCNFNGCKFNNCNFHNSTFIDCNFDYATFEKSYIDSSILDTNLSKFNNLRAKFARTLRINFQSIGDQEAVNKAIKVELKAKSEHLFDCWYSSERYYRDKYQDIERLKVFIEWLWFKLQDLIWGNGEKPKNLIKLGFLLWILATIYDTIAFKNWNLVNNYFDSLIEVPTYFLGVNKPSKYSNFYITSLASIRLIGFALFTSLIIKRYSRR